MASKTETDEIETSPTDLLAMPLQAQYDGMSLVQRVWPNDRLDFAPAQETLAARGRAHTA